MHQRLHIVVQGIVQGVGFRPFIYTQALCLGLSGFVIIHSEAGAERRALISPDTATCVDCLRGIFDPSD